MDFLFLTYIILAIIGLDFNSSISIVGLDGLCVAIFYTISELKKIKLFPLIIMLTSSIIGIPIGIFILHNYDTNKIKDILAVFKKFRTF